MDLVGRNEGEGERKVERVKGRKQVRKKGKRRVEERGRTGKGRKKGKEGEYRTNQGTT